MTPEVMRRIIADEVAKALAAEKARTEVAVASARAGPSPGSTSTLAGRRLPKNGKLVVEQASYSVSNHDFFNLKSNKARQFFRLDQTRGWLTLSSRGDVVKWDGSDSAESMVRLRRGEDNDRVESGAYDAGKQTLVYGFTSQPALAKETETRAPLHQVALLRQEKQASSQAGAEPGWKYIPLKEKAHSGGVTAVAIEPNDPNKRLKFVTAGEDKTLRHWTWHASKGKVDVVNIPTEHSSAISDLSFRQDGDFFYSAGKDKRVIAYDHQQARIAWATVLDVRALHVSPVPGFDNLLLSRKGAIDRQFTLHDLRMQNPAASFGFASAKSVNPSGLTTQGVRLSLGQFYRGDWKASLYAHPDSTSGVRLWDIRCLQQASAETARPRDGYGDGLQLGQHLMGIGSSEVVQSSWTEDGKHLALLGQRGFSKVGLKTLP